MPMPQVSIIIPVYRTEKYLPRVLEAVSRVEGTEYELILVNDGPSPECEEIFERYSKKIKNASITNHRENRGLLQAWLTGAVQAKGEYVHFLDADDSILPQTYAILYQQAQKLGADILQFGGRQVLPSGEIRNWAFAEGWEAALEGKEIVNELFAKKCNWNLWNKIFRHDLIRKALEIFSDMEIPRIAYGNDMPLFYAFCLLGTTYRQADFYPYYYNPSVTSTSFKSFKTRWPEIIHSYTTRPGLLRQIAHKCKVDNHGCEELERWIAQVACNVFYEILEEPREKQISLAREIMKMTDVASFLERSETDDEIWYSLTCETLLAARDA